MQIKCPYCQTAIEVAASGQYTCGQCRAIFKVDLGEGAPAAPPAGAPPLATGGAAGPAAPPGSSAAPPVRQPTYAAPAASAGAGMPRVTAPPPGARCSKHPESEAASVCTRCGSFSCGLCTVPLATGPHCPACAERSRSHGRTTPWDRRRELGWYQAVKQTASGVIFRPAEFFRDMPREGGYESPIGFLMVMTAIQVVLTLAFIWVGGIIGFVVAGGAGRMRSEELGMVVGQLVGQSFMQLCTSPISAILNAFIGGAIMHVCLMIVGGARNGFEATVRVICYAFSAQFLLLALVPVAIVGGVLGALAAAAGAPEAGVIVFGGIMLIGYVAVIVRVIAIEVIGLREAHETTTGRALGAVLLPIVAILCCLGFVVLAIVGAGIR